MCSSQEKALSCGQSEDDCVKLSSLLVAGFWLALAKSIVSKKRKVWAAGGQFFTLLDT